MTKKVAIVTGGSSGIGRATSLLFAKKGYNVVSVGRNETELKTLREKTGSTEGTIAPKLIDLNEIGQIDKFVKEVVDSFGRIDVLVNSAGIIATGSIESTTLENWDKMMGINLRSVFYLMQRCIPYLKKTRGNVVNVSSVAGTRSFPNVLAYCVSKAGVDQLTRCSALELAPKKIRVNAVNPGVVISNLHKRSGMDDEKYKEFLQHSEETHPLGRVGKPDEVADLIYFLASENASWITGATYEIDGGRGQTCAR